MTYAVISRPRIGRRYTLLTLPNGCPKPFTEKEAQSEISEILRRLDKRTVPAKLDEKGNPVERNASEDAFKDGAPAKSIKWGSPAFATAFYETYKHNWTSIPKPIRESLLNQK